MNCENRVAVMMYTGPHIREKGILYPRNTHTHRERERVHKPQTKINSAHKGCRVIVVALHGSEVPTLLVFYPIICIKHIHVTLEE